MAPKRPIKAMTDKPTPTPDVLRAVADLVEPPIRMPILTEEQQMIVDGMNEEIKSDLAQADQFFAKYGGLRVHGNFTINELYNMFKIRYDYDCEHG